MTKYFRSGENATLFYVYAVKIFKAFEGQNNYKQYMMARIDI